MDDVCDCGDTREEHTDTGYCTKCECIQFIPATEDEEYQR